MSKSSKFHVFPCVHRNIDPYDWIKKIYCMFASMSENEYLFVPSHMFCSHVDSIVDDDAAEPV